MLYDKNPPLSCILYRQLSSSNPNSVIISFHETRKSVIHRLLETTASSFVATVPARSVSVSNQIHAGNNLVQITKEFGSQNWSESSGESFTWLINTTRSGSCTQRLSTPLQRKIFEIKIS